VEKYWYILWPFGIFYGYLGYFVTIMYILCSFGTFFKLWYHAQENLATLVHRYINTFVKQAHFFLSTHISFAALNPMSSNFCTVNSYQFLWHTSKLRSGGIMRTYICMCIEVPFVPFHTYSVCRLNRWLSN
jgi:hypothetical protein